MKKGHGPYWSNLSYKRMKNRAEAAERREEYINGRLVNLEVQLAGRNKTILQDVEIKKNLEQKCHDLSVELKQYQHTNKIQAEALTKIKDSEVDSLLLIEKKQKIIENLQNEVSNLRNRVQLEEKDNIEMRTLLSGYRVVLKDIVS